MPVTKQSSVIYSKENYPEHEVGKLTGKENDHGRTEIMTKLSQLVTVPSSF